LRNNPAHGYGKTIGPVGPLFRFGDEADFVALANDSEFGLASYVYSRDIARIWRVAEALQSGMIGINTGLILTEVAPFWWGKAIWAWSRGLKIRHGKPSGN
jgi:acyl-CoA reductase-like NAD-dependent aldehyde dehydrogenase